MPNKGDVAAQEAARIRANLANSRYQDAATALAKRQASASIDERLARAEAGYLAAKANLSTLSGGRGGGRGGQSGGQGRGGGYVGVTSPRVQAIDKAASDVWIPAKVRVRKSSSPVSTYLCADSSASPDLFVQREWFTKYTDVQDQQES
jgi:hypothetical protein